MPSTRQRFGVIMAGGSGERFWPLSRMQRPKQLLHLTSPDRSMLQEAIERLAPLIPREHLYVITAAHLVAPIADGEIGIPEKNIVAEPCKRNTSGALCYILAHILAEHPELDDASVSLAIATADHRIQDEARFLATVDAALAAAEVHEVLVTCGIAPNAPETGFGYIQAEPTPVQSAADGIPVYRVRAFHEKPNRDRAEDFLASGRYYWNSGMFFWRADAFLRELRLARPEMADAFDSMHAALSQHDLQTATEAFETIEDISIDYALMEHTANAWMVRGDFPWSDVGLWPSLSDLLQVDAKGNAVHGEPVLVDAEDCIVYAQTDAGKVAVGIAGVRNLVVVVTDDAVLVVPKDRAQDVRHIVKELKHRDAPQV